VLDSLHAHLDHGPARTDTGQAEEWLLVVLIGGIAVVLHRCAVRRLERNLQRRWNPWRTASFVVGLALIATAVSPPGREFAHADPRGHMLQHLLLGMYAPIALVLSAPVTLALGAGTARLRRWIGAVLGHRAVHVVVHPATAAVVDIGGLYVLYLTPLYALSLQNPLIHVLVLVHLSAAGYLFCWAVAGPDPAPRRPGMPLRVGVLLAAMAAHAVLAKLLYAQADRLTPGSALPSAAALEAAQWMYYGGDLAEVLLAVLLFRCWYESRRR
jgi:putative membrane protein